MFEYRLAQEVHAALSRHHVRYLFLGKSGAILLGYPDTTQDADLFPQKSPENGRALVAALEDLGFSLTDDREAEIVRGKDFVQLRNGPFDLNLIFTPDGVESFEDAWANHVEVEGMPVCHLDQIIASKRAVGRETDMESLPRLIDFREFWRQRLQGRQKCRLQVARQRGTDMIDGEELSMTPTFDSSAFDRATDPVLRLLPVEQARVVAEFRPESSLQDRVEELASKSNAGQLTEAERAEYLGYVQANKFVAILQAQARRRIAERS